MVEAAEDLPENIGELRALVFTKDTLLREKDRRIAELEEQLQLLLHKRFGASSEKSPADQLNLFNEAEAVTNEQAEAATDACETTIPEHKRKKPGRKALDKDLPRIVIEHDIPEEDKICGCGRCRPRIGQDMSEQLDIVPPKVRVLQHLRYKYGRHPDCECAEDDGPAVTIAPMPPQPIPKSNASPAFLAYIVVAKFLDGLPLYRLAKIFDRIGLVLCRGTMAGWMIRMGELIVPLINLMDEVQLGYDILQMDETSVQVLKEPGRAATSKSYMWVRRGGPPSSPVILFDYDPSRAGAVPWRLLADFKGFLQSDGYEGYGATGARETITHVGCLAHARRKFDEAVKAQAKAKNKTDRDGLAKQGLALINRIYAVEREARERDLDANARKQLRDEKAKPIWDELRQWLDSVIGQAPPKTLVGKALGYLDKQWPRLIRCLDDGRIEVDNNLCENAIRPFVLGRKAWLFADTPAGASASARLYSLIETARANGVEPYAYLARVFTELPAAKTAADIEALLPWTIAKEHMEP